MQFSCLQHLVLASKRANSPKLTVWGLCTTDTCSVGIRLWQHHPWLSEPLDLVTLPISPAWPKQECSQSNRHNAFKTADEAAGKLSLKFSIPKKEKRGTKKILKKKKIDGLLHPILSLRHFFQIQLFKASWWQSWGNGLILTCTVLLHQAVQ